MARLKYRQRKEFIRILKTWKWSEIKQYRFFLREKADELSEFLSNLEDQCYSVETEDDDFLYLEKLLSEYIDRLRLVSYALVEKNQKTRLGTHTNLLLKK